MEQIRDSFIRKSMKRIVVTSVVVVVCFTLYFDSYINSNLEVKGLGKNPIPDLNHFLSRNYPHETFDEKEYFTSLQNEVQAVRTRSIGGEWVSEGPGNFGGRVNCIAIDPENDDIIYLGFGRGGLFKTEDGGETWNSIFDEFTYLSISHIEIHPDDHNIIYIGTGDENITRFSEVGNGIYRSVDGGATWEALGLQDKGIIGKMHVAPSDPDIIYASSMGTPFEENDDRGLYKSINAGVDWEQVLFVNDSTGIIDMVVDPLDPNIIFAAGWNRISTSHKSVIDGPDGVIWRSLDGGETWTPLNNHGLPINEISRIGLDMWKGDSKVIFAIFSGSDEVDGCWPSANHTIGVYKTIDQGDTWTPLPTNEVANGFECGFDGGFPWYFGTVRVNPNDVNDIIVLGVYNLRTLDGGQNWATISTLTGTHVDNHDLVFHDDAIYLGTDGGAYVKRGNDDWEDIEDIATSQFYRIAYNPHRPEDYYGGMQDNGLAGGNKTTMNSWEEYNGFFKADGFQMAFHPTDPSLFFIEIQYGWIQQVKNGQYSSYTEGLTGDGYWDMPYFISEVEPDVMYTGTNKVFRRVIDQDAQWNPISNDITDLNDNSFLQNATTAITQSPLEKNNIYVGTSDGVVQRYESDNVWTDISAGLEKRFVSDIKTSRTYANTVFVALNGYRDNYDVPLLYKSDNRGDNWQSIMGDLPPIAINSILILPGYDDRVIFIANEAGVYLTQNGGDNWERVGDDFPYIPTYDLEYNPSNNSVFAGTFGRSILTFDLSQIDFGQMVNTESEVLSSIKLYPTLIDDQLYINNPDNLEFSISILDLSGNLVLKKERVASNINFSRYPKGSYIVRIEKEQLVRVAKVIKI